MQYFVQYLKSLFFNFLTIFFANNIFSGIEVTNQTKLPHIGGDLIFAGVLGFLNSLIFPILKMVDRRVSVLRIIIFSVILNFSAYAVLMLLSSIGIVVLSIKGYLIGSGVVSLGSFLTNYLEMKHCENRCKNLPPEDLEPKE
jgi:uncharacterized membrane protein YvlD (DUF360 family)